MLAQFGSGSKVQLSILKRKKLYNFREKQFYFKKSFFFNYRKIMATEELFSLNGKFMSEILHRLPLFYPMHVWCGSGSVLEIRIHTASEYGSITDKDRQHG